MYVIGILGIEPRLSPYKEPALTIKLYSHEQIPIYGIIFVLLLSIGSSKPVGAF